MGGISKPPKKIIWCLYHSETLRDPKSLWSTSETTVGMGIQSPALAIFGSHCKEQCHAVVLLGLGSCGLHGPMPNIWIAFEPQFTIFVCNIPIVHKGSKGFMVGSSLFWIHSLNLYPENICWWLDPKDESALTRSCLEQQHGMHIPPAGRMRGRSLDWFQDDLGTL
jgi:hypothetical protein